MGDDVDGMARQRLTAFDSLLEASKRGDETAFTALWRWLHPPLVRWLAVVARDDADDLASEVWLAVARALDGFEGGDQQFTAWVFTIARRRVIDGARRRARRPRSSPLDGIDPADPTSAAALSAAEELETTLDLLRQLTPDQREVVALRVIAGMSVAETAQVVGKSEAAVRVLCHRGLRSLADHVDADRLSSEESA
jgi:RNA polymerase sigma-70 factor (ECF subfamily)